MPDASFPDVLWFLGYFIRRYPFSSTVITLLVMKEEVVSMLVHDQQMYPFFGPWLVPCQEV
jgi:hypothetical protein